MRLVTWLLTGEFCCDSGWNLRLNLLLLGLPGESLLGHLVVAVHPLRLDVLHVVDHLLLVQNRVHLVELVHLLQLLVVVLVLLLQLLLQLLARLGLHLG